MEAQLGAIGGTLGLFTGFSICSAAEIIYFGVKFVLGLRAQAQANSLDKALHWVFDNCNLLIAGQWYVDYTGPDVAAGQLS